MRHRRKSLGFTLMEVVIALAILAVALFGSISVITYTTRMNLVARERMLAMRAAEKKIEQMLSTSGDLVTLYQRFSDQTEGLGWEVVDGLEPIDPAPPPEPYGGAYPTGMTARRPVLFVRFPWDSSGRYVTEVDSGKFMGCYTLDTNGNANMAAPVDQDFDGNGQLGADQFLGSDIVELGKLKLLPVKIVVYWKASSGGDVQVEETTKKISGAAILSYKYTFFKKT